MASNAGAAAIADEDDLVAGIVRRMRRLRDPAEPLVDAQRAALVIGDLDIPDELVEDLEIAVGDRRDCGDRGFARKSFRHFSSPVIPLMSAGFSIELR